MSTSRKSLRDAGFHDFALLRDAGFHDFALLVHMFHITNKI